MLRKLSIIVVVLCSAAAGCDKDTRQLAASVIIELDVVGPAGGAELIVPWAPLGTYQTPWTEVRRHPGKPPAHRRVSRRNPHPRTEYPRPKP